MFQSSGGQRSETDVLTGFVPSKGCEEESVQCLSSFL